MIIESTVFFVQLFGKKLTNEVVDTIRGYALGPRCESLRMYIDRYPDVLFVDDHHLAKHCQRECVIKMPNYYCGAWLITTPPR